MTVYEYIDNYGIYSFEEEKFKCEFDLDQAKEIFYQILFCLV